MVLVSILGDFHSSVLPIFFEFKASIKKHVLIYTADLKDYALRLKKGQEFFLKIFEIDAKTLEFSVETRLVVKDDLENLKLCANYISSLGGEIFVNITDGNASIGLVLAQSLLKTGAKILVYDKNTNTYSIHTNEKILKCKLTHNIDIKNHLRLKGLEIKSFSSSFELILRKDIILELAKDLPRLKRYANNEPDSKYQALIEKLPKKAQKTSYIQGSIFEEFIYWTIKDNLKIDDIMTGVKVDLSPNVENEFDVLIMKDNHLHILECKFSHNFELNAYLYKMDSMIKHIDSDAKAMIVSIGNKPINNANLKRGDLVKTYIFSTNKFDKEQFLSCVMVWFGLERLKK